MILSLTRGYFGLLNEHPKGQICVMCTRQRGYWASEGMVCVLWRVRSEGGLYGWASGKVWVPRSIRGLGTGTLHVELRYWFLSGASPASPSPCRPPGANTYRALHGATACVSMHVRSRCQHLTCVVFVGVKDLLCCLLLSMDFFFLRTNIWIYLAIGFFCR